MCLFWVGWGSLGLPSSVWIISCRSWGRAHPTSSVHSVEAPKTLYSWICSAHPLRVSSQALCQHLLKRLGPLLLEFRFWQKMTYGLVTVWAYHWRGPFVIRFNLILGPGQGDQNQFLSLDACSDLWVLFLPRHMHDVGLIHDFQQVILCRAPPRTGHVTTELFLFACYRKTNSTLLLFS